MTASSAPKQAFTTPAADGTPGKPSPILSSAVKVGNRLYVSGMLGNTRREQGQHRGADQGDCWRASAARCKAAGFGWGDVVDGIVYITDVEQLRRDERRLPIGLRRTSRRARR